MDNITIKRTILANRENVSLLPSVCSSTSCLLSQLITSPQCARGLWRSHCRLLLRSNTECKSGHGPGKVKQRVQKISTTKQQSFIFSVHLSFKCANVYTQGNMFEYQPLSEAANFKSSIAQAKHLPM